MMMREKVKVAFAVTFAALFQTACVASSIPMTCSVSGQKHLPRGIEASEVCSAFSARLEEALAKRGASDASDGMAFALTLNGRGSIEVQAIAPGEGQDAKTLDAAVDVMDRDIQVRDFDRLADTLADILAE